MKRDMDLVRQILLACEADESGYAPDELSVDGYSAEQIAFHVYLMGEAGLLQVSDVTTMGSASPEAMPRRITWEGYEFLDASRNEENWSRAKSIGAKVGGMGLDVLKSVLTELAKAGAKKALGLP